MASEKGCQQPTDAKYCLPDGQEAGRNYLFRTSIRTNNILRFFLEENPVIIHIAVVIVSFFDKLTVAVYINVKVFV